MDSQHDVVQGTLLAVSWSQLIAQVRFFSPKQKVRPTFIFHPKTPFFFHPKVAFFPWCVSVSPWNYVGLSMSCQIPAYCDPFAEGRQRIVVEIQGLHAFRCHQLLRMGTLVTLVPLWVLECLKRMAAWCFFSCFLRCLDFFGALYQNNNGRMDLTNNQPKLEDFRGASKTRFQPGFLFLFLSPEGRKWLRPPNSTIEGTKLPCTWSQILLEAELGYSQRAKNPLKLRVW